MKQKWHEIINNFFYQVENENGWPIWHDYCCRIDHGVTGTERTKVLEFGFNGPVLSHEGSCLGVLVPSENGVKTLYISERVRGYKLPWHTSNSNLVHLGRILTNYLSGEKRRTVVVVPGYVRIPDCLGSLCKRQEGHVFTDDLFKTLREEGKLDTLAQDIAKMNIDCILDYFDKVDAEQLWRNQSERELFLYLCAAYKKPELPVDIRSALRDKMDSCLDNANAYFSRRTIGGVRCRDITRYDAMLQRYSVVRNASRYFNEIKKLNLNPSVINVYWRRRAYNGMRDDTIAGEELSAMLDSVPAIKSLTEYLKPYFDKAGSPAVAAKLLNILEKKVDQFYKSNNIYGREQKECLKTIILNYFDIALDFLRSDYIPYNNVLRLAAGIPKEDNKTNLLVPNYDKGDRFWETDTYSPIRIKDKYLRMFVDMALADDKRLENRRIRQYTCYGFDEHGNLIVGCHKFSKQAILFVKRLLEIELHEERTYWLRNEVNRIQENLCIKDKESIRKAESLAHDIDIKELINPLNDIALAGPYWQLQILLKDAEVRYRRAKDDYVSICAKINSDNYRPAKLQYV